MNHKEAKKFFLKQEQYSSLELPDYFKFENLLKDISKKLQNADVSSWINEHYKPQHCDDVNYKIYNNKDGCFAWRCIELLNPVLYVDLVHYITKEDVWLFLKQKFAEFQSNENIVCASIPVVKDNKKSKRQAQQILSWWERVEQQSIIQFLDFSYIFSTDLTDCYGTIYTHSFSWALHGKEYSKEHLSEKNIGYYIDKKIRYMTYNQTNGIPQGSVLMDFLAEIVLGYADYLLSEKIADSIKEYKIIRYRDDYKIFVNNNADGDKIIKYLTEVMIELGLKLNATKTNQSEDIITKSIKEDKMYYLSHFQNIKYEYKGKKHNQKYLLKIYNFAKKFPNSGQLKRLLNDYNKAMKISCNTENVETLISIVFAIAYNSPKVYSISIAIISKLLTCLQNKFDKQYEIVDKIMHKLALRPNTEYLEIWLQRMIYNYSFFETYNSKLCKLVMSEKTNIWNNIWLKDSLRNFVDNYDIVERQILSTMDNEIPDNEVNPFVSIYD